MGPETALHKLTELVTAVHNAKTDTARMVLYNADGEKVCACLCSACIACQGTVQQAKRLCFLQGLFELRASPARGPFGHPPVCKLSMFRTDAIPFKTAAVDDGSCKLIVEATKPFRIVACTDAFQSRFGFTREQTINRTAGLIQGPGTDIRAWLALFESALAGRSQHLNLVHTYSHDGSDEIACLRMTPVLGASDIDFVLVAFNPPEPFADLQKGHDATVANVQSTTTAPRSLRTCESHAQPTSISPVRLSEHVAKREAQQSEHTFRAEKHRIGEAKTRSEYVAPSSTSKPPGKKGFERSLHRRSSDSQPRSHMAQSERTSRTKSNTPVKACPTWRRISASPNLNMGQVIKHIGYKVRFLQEQISEKGNETNQAVSPADAASSGIVSFLMSIFMYVLVVLHLTSNTQAQSNTNEAKPPRTPDYHRSWTCLHSTDDVMGLGGLEY